MTNSLKTMSRRHFIAAGGLAATSLILGPKTAMADDLSDNTNVPMPTFSCTITDIGQDGKPMNLSTSEEDSFEESWSAKLVEANKGVEQKEDGSYLAKYSVDLVEPVEDGISLFSQGAYYEDILVRLEVEVDYQISDSSIKIIESKARITKTNSLLRTGERNHLTYAGIIGVCVERRVFDTYSVVRPNWGWVPWSPPGSSYVTQNGTRAQFEAWPYAMEGSRKLIDAVVEV